MKVPPAQTGAIPIWGVVLVVVLAAGSLVYFMMRPQSESGTGPAASAAVSRLLGTHASEGLGRLEGVMTIRLCTHESSAAECAPAPELYAFHRVSLLSEDEELYTLIPDTEGNFSSMLSPGTYVADVDHEGIGDVSGVPAAVVIESGQVATLLIDIDASEAR